MRTERAAAGQKLKDSSFYSSGKSSWQSLVVWVGFLIPFSFENEKKLELPLNPEAKS